MSHTFISYIREDSEQVLRLANDLQRHGVSVWLDRERILPGMRWQDAIRKAIQQGSFFLACFSERYFRRSKTYQNEELILAIEELRQSSRDRVWFIPVLLTHCEVPDFPIGTGETLRNIHYIDLSQDWGNGVKTIASVIQPLSIPDAFAAQLRKYKYLSEQKESAAKTPDDQQSGKAH